MTGYLRRGIGMGTSCFPRHADRVPEPDALIIEVEPQWCSSLDAIANLWLNDGAPDHLLDGLARLQAVFALNNRP
jgi:hypothetical protein